MSLFNLFKSKQPEAPKDGLTQPQREAILDLLNICIYADNHIAIAEGKVLEDFSRSLDWDPSVGFSAFEMASITRARQAKEDETYRAEYLQTIKTRLDTDRAKKLAEETAKHLISADGVKTDSEQAVLSTIGKLLF